MLRACSMILLLAGCTGSTETDTDLDTDPDTDPIVVDCDVDGDGAEAESCGGDDCDDDDPDIGPGRAERLGDDVDQDCNGKPNLGFVTSVTVDGAVAGRWTFDDQGTVFGGLGLGGGGQYEAYTVPVQLDGVADVQVRSSLVGDLTAPPHRVWSGVDGWDVVTVQNDAEGRTLQIVGPDGTERRQALGGAAASWLSAANVDGEVEVVACGGGVLTWTALSGDSVTQAALQSDADRCEVLSAPGSPILLTGTADVGPLNRWRVRDGEITDRVQIISNKSLAIIGTSTQGDQALYAFTDAERIYVFDSQARGAILEGDGRISQLAVSGDGEDGYALAWVTSDGRLSVAWGDIEQDPTIFTTLIPDATTPVAVSITSEALTVAWVDAGAWQIERALR